MRAGLLVLTVRLTPKSARDKIDGVGRLSDGRCVLLARVRPAARRRGQRRSDSPDQQIVRIRAAAIRIESGATGGLKTLVLTGDAQAHKAALETVASRVGGRG
jgi:uncharacterized protein YggU (UPF0235/DUF167 family)